MLVPKTTVSVAAYLPVCFAVLPDTLCFPLKEQPYAASEEQYSDYHQLSMVSTVGLRTQEGIHHTLNSPLVPPCTLDTSHKDSDSWSLCRGPNATVAVLPKSPFVMGNWGANWKVLAKRGITIVPAQPLYLYTNMWWEGPGTGTPIDHTSP